MLISHRKKFIYTKTVKTAGTSVESFFEKYCMPEKEWEFVHGRDQYVGTEGIIRSRGVSVHKSEWYNHMSAIDIKNKIGVQTWDDYFKFCVIRNPFDKVISMYFHEADKGQTNDKADDDPVRDFRNWLGSQVSGLDRNKYVIGGEVCLDYFIRFEDLEGGIKFVCDTLGLPYVNDDIPKLKTGMRDQSVPLKDFYSAPMKEMVEKLYQFELNTFGYRFPS